MVKNSAELAFSMNVDEICYDRMLEEYFSSDKDLLERLKKLKTRKEYMKWLKERYGSLDKPIVLTVSGTPRAGKTTCIDNLLEYFKKCGFKTYTLEEPAGLVYQTLKSKEEKDELLKDRVGFVEQQLDIGVSSIESNLSDSDIILCDRGILDTFIWYDMYYRLGMMDSDRYNKFLKHLQDKKNYYDYLYILYTNPRVSMLRDYLNSLSLEPRSTMNEENVRRYNTSLLNMEESFIKSTDGTMVIDTTDLARMDASIGVANDVLDKMEGMYLRRKK